MNTQDFKRKLTAILSADVKGYSRLMGENEAETVRILTAYRKIMGELIQQHSGRVIDSPGDNILAEFGSVVDAVQCSVAAQNEFKARNAGLPENRRMIFRIGVNLGDVIEEEGRIYGDGVNIAARIEGLAEPGGICISGTAFDHVKNKVSVGYQYLGKQTVKNIPDPVRAYKVLMKPESAGKVMGEKEPSQTRWVWKAVVATAVLILVGGGLAWNFYWRAPKIERASKEKMAFPLPDKPSIAVLPFVNMTGDSKQEYIADGITENVITALSKVPEVFVIARNSVFTYKEKPVKINRVSEELGVQYVLEGSIQQSESRLRITAQLIDATGGHHLWAERFDRDLSDIFVLQDKVTLDILSALRVEFTHGEQARVQETTKSLEAWSCLVRGLSHFESFTKDDNAKAQELFNRAVQVDSGYSYAWAMLGWTHWIDAAFGYSESSGESFKKAVEIAQKSAQMDDRLPDVHALWGAIYLFQGHYDKAVAEGQRAVALSPNVACNKALLARTMLFAGRIEESMNLAKSAIRHNPHYPSWYLESLAMGYSVLGEHENAIESYKELLNHRRKARGNALIPLLGLAANCAILGRANEAKAYVGEILEINPEFSLEQYQKINLFKDSSHLKPFLDALRKAGLPEKPPLPLPDKPSIAVLPFVNMSDDPKQEFFSDGMTEEIITTLSKSPYLFVIARQSTFTYKGKPVKVKQVSEELGVRYVLEGSVRRSGEKVRITAQFIDAMTGFHLWAERFDRDLKDIFTLQDEITLKIMKSVHEKLELKPTRRSGRGAGNVESFLKTMEGLELLLHATQEDNVLARKLFEEAVALDPNNATAYTHLAWTYMADSLFGKSPKESKRRAIELVRRAVALDELEAYAHASLGCFSAYAGHFEEAIVHAERGITLDPNSSGVLFNSGLALALSGKPEEAIPLVQKATRLNPFAPSIYFCTLSIAYRMAGRFDEAVEQAKKAVDRNRKDLYAYLALAAGSVLAGREPEARAAAEEILKIDPAFSVEQFGSRLPYKDKSFVDRSIDAWRKAGLK